ncbi:hypothetical protein QYF61_002442 [Mycteria americana]|uniref:Core shell protein Gag P30 domain-containing protein n=1 Tax=Mycteria americana TaxID=33587 RepID=A0AAN7RJE5_MYCAM|nr:hypothetical protein QYF61_005373 [Mycteria americana]KAK4829177.1 hypothetical protein QYF61_002442 [Mycteria americana]
MVEATTGVVIIKYNHTIHLMWMLGRRTAARTDLLIGDSIGSSPAVRRGEPGWDPNTGGGSQGIRECQKCILCGIQRGIQKPQNWAKLCEIRQGDEDPPWVFSEKLCEAAGKRANLDPADENDSRLLNVLFIGQAAPDIRKKLQKVDGADGMTISPLLSTACKGCNNREKEKQKKSKLQASLLATLSEGQGRGRGGGRGNFRGGFRGPLSKIKTSVIGATGKRTRRSFLQPVECTIGNTTVSRSFLYMPECPLPLSGQDLLCKLNAQITSSENLVQLHIPPENAWKAQMGLLTQGERDENADVPEEGLNAAIPLVWASGKPGRAKSVSPVQTELNSGAQPGRKGLEALINSFVEYGLLRECQSECNTAILPVRKPNSQEYGLVQDLWEINSHTVDVHPAVPKPYTSLASIPENHLYFTVLD